VHVRVAVGGESYSHCSLMPGRGGTKQLGLVLAFLVVAAGCIRSTDHSGVSVEARFAPEPAHVGKETVFLTLKDSSGRPVSGAQVTAEGNMSHPGMAPVFADTKEIAAGQYRAEMDLGMAGSWVVLLHVRLASGEKIERQMALEVKAD
jgi:YtkA-like